MNEWKRLLFIPSLVQDRGNAVYPFTGFPVFGPISPTVCDTLKAVLTNIKPGIDAWVHRLGDSVIDK